MSGLAPAIQVSMKDLVKLVTALSPDIPVCIRGRHAVGKSEGVVQISSLLRSDFYKNPENCAKMVEALKEEPTVAAALAASKDGIWTYEMGMPVIQRRLSQMTEGDVTGLPSLTGRGTTFKPCTWLMDACEFPSVVFLDERNRALDGVKQACFELMDSKAFYGNRLHRDSRIVVAENVGDQYSVNSNDPAEISRAATVELAPDAEEWVLYCQSKGIHSYVIDFIRANKGMLEHLDGSFEANTKYPDRRSWFKLAKELDRLGLFETPENHLFYTMTGSMVGVVAALAFKKYCCNVDKNITAEDIVKNWASAKAKLGSKVTHERYMELGKKLIDHLKKVKLTEDQGKELGKWMHDSPAEPRCIVWAAIQSDLKNLFQVHKHVSQLMVETAAGQDTTLNGEESVSKAGKPRQKR
jgi:hypothetical protein